MSLVEKALKKLHESRAIAELASTAARGAAEALPEGAAAAVAAESSRKSRPTAPRSGKVVSVNQAALRGAGFFPAEGDEQRLAREYGHIKRPLIAAAKGKGVPRVPNGRVIMVASALPGEGKTFTTINLALSLAREKDTTVLLVDADIAKSHLSQVFGVSAEPGLMDVLLDESKDIESVIIPTSVRGLSILPAGHHSATATESLASTRMERLVSDLSSDADRIILLDSPPLLLTTESRALAAIAGQILIVVRAEATTHQAVRDALACVNVGKPVGVILNQSRFSPQTYYGEYDDAPASPA